MRIRDIQLRKYNEKKKENEKMSRQGTQLTMKTEEEQKEEEPASAAPVRLTAAEIKKLQMESFNTGTMSLSEAQKLAEEEKKERLTYGRFWVWEGYFNEKFKDKWLETAEALKHINDHVL